MPQWRHYWFANNYSMVSSQGWRFKLHPAKVGFAAILDRVMHNAIVFNIRGLSWRLRKHHGLRDGTGHGRQRGNRRGGCEPAWVEIAT
jgi:hypothetical protein